MRLDLVDLLRCPRPHEEMPLVCVARTTNGRELLDATLGCPSCHAEFSVRDGVAWLGTPAPSAASSGVAAIDPITLAAMLGLASPGGTVALSGPWGEATRALAEIAETHVVLLSDDAAAGIPGLVSVVGGAAGVPFARGTLRALALASNPSRSGALEACLVSAARVLMHGGRLVAPAWCSVPSAFHEVARDTRWWVAEHRVESPAIALQRAPRPGEPRSDAL